MTEKKVKVTLVRSLIGTKESHRATVRGLGLRR
jgi:large subunit ribosomal protein L30